MADCLSYCRGRHMVTGAKLQERRTPRGPILSLDLLQIAPLAVVYRLQNCGGRLRRSQPDQAVESRLTRKAKAIGAAEAANVPLPADAGARIAP